jgi:hypothetical protein
MGANRGASVLEERMNQIVEIDERGVIQLPDDLLATVKPHTRFLLEIDGATLILRPEEQPFWSTASPVERAEAVRRWAALDRPPVPVLTDEALSSEQMIYDR